LGSRVSKKGSQKDSKGRLWQRYLCTSPVGKPHRFQVLKDDAGFISLPVGIAPVCVDHKKSKVVRYGTYGKWPKRQRYRCTAESGTTHVFAQELPREQVEVASEKCSGCDEFLSVHKGSQASSRHSKWSLDSVVEALREVSLGVSYSQASQNIQDKTSHTITHSIGHEETWKVTGEIADHETLSWSSERGKNSWRIAADLVEQYGPVLFTAVINPIRIRQERQRLINDKIKAEGKIPALPITFILDELPVYLRFAGAKKSQLAWTIYVVAEIQWKPGKGSYEIPRRETRLCLVRALPGSVSPEGWRLVLDELGVIPDVVISDFGSTVISAIRTRYASKSVILIPSLYHFSKSMARVLMGVSGQRKGPRGGPSANPLFVDHLNLITRDELVAMGVLGWAQWWDELEKLARKEKLPLASIQIVRNIYEDDFARAISSLIEQPYLPASNAGIEIKIRGLVKPLLEGRAQRYRNLARTNTLFDLLVCQEYKLFNSRKVVANLIRNDNLISRGWATPQRSFNDRRNLVSKGKSKIYSSLLDTSRVGNLLTARSKAKGNE